MPVEYIGLTRLIQDFAAMLTAFAGLGFAGPFYRFGPYFEKYSKPGGNDLLQLFLIVTHIGVLVVFCVCYLFRADIIANFQVKSPLFSTYFYATFLFAYFFIIYNLLELYLFSKGQAILQSFTREILIRIIVLALTLLTFYFVSLRQFVWLYAGHSFKPDDPSDDQSIQYRHSGRYNSLDYSPGCHFGHKRKQSFGGPGNSDSNWGRVFFVNRYH